LPSTSNQATNALTNLSRVAQDAPYGFIGIANNLNPLLESFQRLQKEAGGSGAALKAMAGGLMGPAGIGLALGAVSSIIVAFGPKIADFIKGTNEDTKAEDKLAQSLSDARAEASETGIRLQAYLTITQNASVSDARRAEALKAVQNELGKVNSAYAATITNVDQARSAVDLYTKALVAQAMSNGYSDASIVQAGSIAKAKDANLDARNAALQLRSGIISLNTELANTITLALDNPFYVLDKGAKQLANTTKEVANNIQRIGKQAREITPEMTAPVLMERGAAPTITSPTGNAPLGGRTSGFNAISATRDINEQAKAQAILNMQLAQTQEITNLIAPAFNSVIEAMAMGEDIGLALEQAFKQIVVQLVQMIAQALLFKAIMAGISGGTSEIGSSIGSGLGMLFGGNGGGQFVLKGQDLLLATNRAQKASNLKGQSISLA